MNVVDTSAVVAVLFGEPGSPEIEREMGVPLLFVGEDFAQTDVLVA